MTKQINPDVAAFKDDFFKGLTFRECIYGGSALIAGVGGILILVYFFSMNINLAITFCIPIIGLIGLCGFYEKNGMTLIQIIKRKAALMKQGPLTWQSGVSVREKYVKTREKKTFTEKLLTGGKKNDRRIL